MNAMEFSPICSVHNRTGSDSESGDENSPFFGSVEARKKLQQQDEGSPPCRLRTPPEKRSSGVQYPTNESFKEMVDHRKRVRKLKEEEEQAQQQQNQEKLQRAAAESKVREDDGEGIKRV